MCIPLLLSAFFVIVTGESCTTPSGQAGECVPIRSCPSLLFSFSNPKKELNEYVNKFTCPNGESGLMVCCQMPNDQLVFENDEDNSDPNDVTRLKELLNPEGCGIANDSVIQDGITRLQDFPWLVKIMVVLNSNKKDRYESVGCTGVVINQWYVLYSAQCFYVLLREFSPRFVLVDSYSNKQAGCGDETSYSPKCRYEDSYESILNKAHPFYDDQTKFNDIAIIRLNRPIDSSEYIRPICLPIAHESIKVGQMLQTVGWNRTFNVNHVSVKRIQSSVVISNMDCKKSLRESGEDVTISPYEMCTYAEKNIFGDDDVGFPLMSLRNGRWYLEGFESQGKNTKVHSRVQNYLQWIKEEMGEERCRMPFTEIGEGRPLSDCPALLDIIANVSPDDEEAFRNFFWERDEDPNNSAHTIKVCCPVDSNFTRPPETANRNLDSEVYDFDKCGLQNGNFNSSTESASVEEFPWLAVVVNASLPKQRDGICGGSLISDRYVLTSALCISKLNQNDKILVQLGVHKLSSSNDCPEETDCSSLQEYGVETEIVHPFYDKFSIVNGIALLRLNKKVTFTDNVRPICLPRSEDDQKNYGEILYASGFGHRSASVVGSRTKKKIKTSLISNQNCAEKFKALFYILPVRPHHICTEDVKNSTDVICTGDEGGPLMLSKGSKWYIVGITGYYACRRNEPQIHLNVYKYLRWIKLNIKD